MINQTDVERAGDRQNLTNVVVIRLMGGLGNQMFQYAAAVECANRWSARIEVDPSLLGRNKLDSLDTQREFELEDLFVGPFEVVSFLRLSRLYPKSSSLFNRLVCFLLMRIAPADLRIQSNHHTVEHSAEPKRKLIGLVGRFQSQKYFANSESLVREAFRFKEPWPETASDLRELLQQADTVGIHVRRGDYVSNPIYNETLGFVGEQYLRSSMSYAQEVLGSPVNFVVFSDDPEWCEEFFDDSVLVNRHCFFDNPAHSDFRLMVECKNLIISNSTYSWWAAKLGEPYGGIVIAPKQWASSGEFDVDVIPPGWITL